MIKKITSQLLLSVAPAVGTFFLIYYMQVNQLTSEQFAKMDYVWGFSKFICSIMILPLPLYYAREAKVGISFYRILRSTKKVYLCFVLFSSLVAFFFFNHSVVSLYELVMIIFSSLLFSVGQIISSYLIGTSKVVQSSLLKIMPQTLFIISLWIFDIVDAIVYSSLASLVFSLCIFFFSQSSSQKESLSKEESPGPAGKLAERKLIALLMLEVNFFLYIDRVVLPHIISEQLYQSYLNIRYLTTPVFLIGTFLESFFFSRMLSDTIVKRITYYYTPLCSILLFFIFYYGLEYVPKLWIPEVILENKCNVALIIAASLVLIPYSIVSTQFNAQADNRDFLFAVVIIYPLVIISYVIINYFGDKVGLGLKGVILALTASYLIRILCIRFKPKFFF